MKTFFALVCACLLFFQSRGQAKFSVKCLSISTSTVQTWSPGNVQTGGKPNGGVIYQIEAVLKKSGDLKFDSLLVEGISLPIEVMKGTDRNYGGSFKKEDQITLLARRNKNDSYRKNSLEISKLISSKKDAVAFISIWVKGKRYLQPVTEFKKASRQNVNQ